MKISSKWQHFRFSEWLMRMVGALFSLVVIKYRRILTIHSRFLLGIPIPGAMDQLRASFSLRYYCDVMMSTKASQITSLTIVYSTVYSGADERKHQSSASLAFVREIHRWPVNSPHKGPVTPKMFPFDDVIMKSHSYINLRRSSDRLRFIMGIPIRVRRCLFGYIVAQRNMGAYHI